MKYLFYMVLISNAMIAYAQKSNIDLKQQVDVGQAMPIIPDQSALFYREEEININDFEHKVLVLDFFDTYCKSCIESLPKLQLLQDKMIDDLQIVLVTWQDRETIVKFWKSNAFIREHQIRLPIIYGDTILRNYFPHQVIPHVAWSYKGYIKAITHSDFVTVDRIQELVTNNRIDVPLKYDFETSVETITHGGIKGSTNVTEFQEGRPTQSYTYGRDSLSGMFKTSIYNMPIFNAYTATWSKVRKPTFILKPERIVWNVKDSSVYRNYGETGTGQVWLSEHGICYERYDEIARAEDVQAQIVLQDLNNFLGMHVYWSSREMPALVLKGTYVHPSQDHELVGQRYEGTSVLAFGMDMAGRYPPIVDRVKSKEVLVIPAYNSIDELNHHLAVYGLSIEHETAEVEVLVFQEEVR